MNPVVSVLVPTYNAGDYLRQCMDSLVGQTYEHLQIIAINDGSTDGSPEVLREYAARDSRIQIIDKPNSGYGDSMNCGLAAATGTYIGIVEPDDYIDKGMYAAYVRAAEQAGADIVKSNYFEHAAKGRDTRLEMFAEAGIPTDRPFNPRDYPAVLTVRPSIWSGIYRRDMLVREGIDFAPTPGASFQDTSFCHMCWIAARKAVVLEQAFLRYRTDNESSSSNSSAKVYAACDEFDRSLAFLKARGEADVRAFGPTLGAMRFGCYVWHFNRIAPKFRQGFAERWSREMHELEADGLVDFDLLRPASLDQACLLMAAPSDFVEAYPQLDWPGFALGPGERGLSSAGTPLSRASLSPVTDPAALPSTPKATIVVPIFNVQSYVRECIESLLAQTRGDFEVICVDDGSTDHSLAMAKAAARGDVRFTFLTQENGGQSKARNRAIDQARGEYLLMLDSDDLYVSDAFERLCARAERDNLDYLDFTAHTFYETPDMKSLNDEDYYENRTDVEGVMSGRELFVRYQQAEDYCCSLALHFFKRSLLADAGLRFMEGVIHEDELFSPVLLASAQRAAFMNEQLYLRRVRANSSMTTKRGLRNVVCLLKVLHELDAWLHADMEGCDGEGAADGAPARRNGEGGATGHDAGASPSNTRSNRSGDDAFHAALAQRIAFLRQILASDADLAGDEALAEYESSLSGEELVEFELLVRGGLNIRRQAFAEMQQSRVYRVGDILTKIPRKLLRAVRPAE